MIKKSNPVELYKFCVRSRLPKRSFGTWYDTLTDDEKEQIEAFKAEVLRTIQVTIDELDIGNIFNELGSSIASGIVNGCHTP